MFTRLNVSLETYEEGCWQILNYENVERKSKDSLPTTSTGAHQFGVATADGCTMGTIYTTVWFN